jgi:hypothetical protein
MPVRNFEDLFRIHVVNILYRFHSVVLRVLFEACGKTPELWSCSRKPVDAHAEIHFVRVREHPRIVHFYCMVIRALGQM